MINASPSNPRSLSNGSRYVCVIAVSIVVGALLALPLFIGSASSPTTPIDRITIKHKIDNSTSSSVANVAIPNFNMLMPQAGPVTVDTFAGNCTDSKTVFNLQDANLAVCAKFTNAVPGWTVIWSNARGTAVQTSPITAVNSSATFMLTPSSNLGDWRVILYEPFGGAVQAVATFTVVDAANPKADLSVNKSLIGNTASANSQVLFSVQVTNGGPSDAAQFSYPTWSLQIRPLYLSNSLLDQRLPALTQMRATQAAAFATSQAWDVERLPSSSLPTWSTRLQMAL